MKKRVLGMILATVLLLAFIPTNPATQVKAATTINVGDYILMGKYYDEPILWRCVGMDANGPLMLADRILTIKPFDASGNHEYLDGAMQADPFGFRLNTGSNLWETSNLRSWLNSTATARTVIWLDECPPTMYSVWDGYNGYSEEKGFLAEGNFTASERTAIKSITQKSILNGLDAGKLGNGGTTAHLNDPNIVSIIQNYDTAYYQNVTDKVFLLDVKQLNTVYQNSSILGTNYYIGKPTQNAIDNSDYRDSSWNSDNYIDNWLRTPYAEPDSCNYLRAVSFEGHAGLIATAYNGTIGVRPAFYLNLSSVTLQAGNGTVADPYALAANNVQPRVNITTGVFQDVEWGDYLHLQMIGDDGSEYSFFVLRATDVDLESLVKGQRIKVTWQNVDKFIDPPGEEVNLDEILDVELITASQSSSSTSSLVPENPTENKYRLVIEQDNNGFTHSGSSFFKSGDQKYFLSEDLYEKLTANQPDSIKNEIKSEMDSEWGGSCRGMSTSMALSKTKDVDLNHFDKEAQSFFTAEMPKDNHDIRDLINYYQLAQYLPNIMDANVVAYKPAWYDLFGIQKNTLKDVLSGIVDKVKNVKNNSDPLLIIFGWTTNVLNETTGQYEKKPSGHCIVGNSYESTPEGDHKIEIVDPNDIDNYVYLIISNDFSSWRIEKPDGSEFYKTSDWTYIGYFELDDLDSIDIDGSGNTNKNTTILQKGTTITMGNPTDFSISNESGDTFTLSELEGSGDLIPESIRFIDKVTADGNAGSEMVLRFSQKDAYTILPKAETVDVSVVDDTSFASVEASNVTDVEFILGSEVNINGENCSYSAYISNTSSSDNDLIRILDENGGNIKIEQTDDGIILYSDTLDDVRIQLILNREKIESVVTTDKNSLLIIENPDNKSGSIQMLVSSKDNGKYDKVIATSGVSESQPTDRTGLYLLIGILAFIVLAVALLVILLLMKKRKTPGR